MKEQARGCSPSISTLCSLIAAVLGSGGKPGPRCCAHHPIAHGIAAGAQSPAAGLGNRMGCADGDRRGCTGGICWRGGRSGGRAGEEPCSQTSSPLRLQVCSPGICLTAVRENTFIYLFILFFFWVFAFVSGQCNFHNAELLPPALC